MKAAEVRTKLPHRYPMVMLDEIETISDSGAVGYKNVTVNEPHFRGHFPNAPVMPGVLILESLCQLVWLWNGREDGVRLCQIKKLRFRRTTVPGDRLRLEIELLERLEGSVTVKATASVDEQAAVTGQLTFAFP